MVCPGPGSQLQIGAISYIAHSIHASLTASQSRARNTICTMGTAGSETCVCINTNVRGVESQGTQSTDAPKQERCSPEHQQLSPSVQDKSNTMEHRTLVYAYP